MLKAKNSSLLITENSKKHILHFPRWYPHSDDPQNGIFIYKHIKSVKDRYNNSVLFVKSRKQKEAYNIVEKTESGIYNVTVYFKNSENTILNIIRYLKGFKKGVKLILNKNGKPSLIHVHVLLRTGLAGVFYSVKFQTPLIVSEHWSGYITGAFSAKNFIYKKLTKLVFERASAILVVSPNIKKALVNIGINDDKVEIINNVVEASENVTATNKKDKITMLSVADLEDNIKKISEIIEVYSELKNRDQIEYFIVGDGTDRKNLEYLAKEKGVLNKGVKFLGRKTNDEVLEIIANCDFLVMNSVTETFSVVTAEALLAGKPVIATRCGGPEYFVNQSNGILIKAGNKKELKEAIEKMCLTYTNYNPEKIKETIKKKFSSQAVGLQLTKIYERYINK